MTDIRETETPFQPDWRLGPAAVLACHLKIQLHRSGIDWTGKLDTDERWERLALTVINGLKNDCISPIKFVEMPRAWDAPANPDIRAKVADAVSELMSFEGDMPERIADAALSASGYREMRKALEKLERAAAKVSQLGATTGPQWVGLSSAILTARSALSPKEGT